MNKLLLPALCFILLAFCSLQNISAQNTSPYWSLTGNSTASGSSKLGTTNNVPLRLTTNNSIRLYISPNPGNIGIGTTSPTSRLHVNTSTGTSPLKVQINNATKLFMSSKGGLSIGADTIAPENGLYITGKVGIGTTEPVDNLEVVGRGHFTIGLKIGKTNVLRSPNPFALEAYGDKSTGTGVYGEGATGVYGLGYYGVYGDGTYGMYSKGTVDGVVAYGVAHGVNAYAFGVNSFGVSGVANGDYSIGMYGVASYDGVEAQGGNSGVSAYSNNIAVYGNSPYYAGYFNGSVFSTNSYTSSDQKLKKNIKDVPGALDIISKLKPRSYEFKQDGSYRLMNLPQGKHYGLIAQDVEQVLPNLVKETMFNTRMSKATIKKDSTGATIKNINPPNTEIIDFKAINYTELIPILIKAVQEQQTQIEELKAEVHSLKEMGGVIKTYSGGLEQLSPNPANGTTRITYQLPKGVYEGQLLLTDATGRMVKSVSLGTVGYADVNTSTFSSGVYNCTLIVEGKSLDTKKLVIAH